MNRYKNGFLTILFLIGITSAALAYMGARESSGSSPLDPVARSGGNEIITVHTALTQDKVMRGTDGNVSVALTLSAKNFELSTANKIQPVDLVVVLDRSGSMNGRKLHDAKKAVINLLDQLTYQDRISIITYSNGVEILSGLVHVNDPRVRIFRRWSSVLTPVVEPIWVAA